MSDNLLTTENTGAESASRTTNTANPGAEPKLEVRTNGQSDPKFFTQEDIEKAREQEKSKLYKRLETMQETVARLEQEARSRAEAEEAKQREIQTTQQQQEAEARKRQEAEMSTKELLAQKEHEWRMQLSMLEEKVEQEKALRERETQFAELMDYRQRVIQQYSDRVAPELLDLIDGNTPEEITQSAEDMAGRTDRILAQTTEALQNQRQQMPTVRATAPASGENSGSQQSFTPDEIREMSMADYAKHRRSLLGKGTDGPRNRGLFG